MDNWQVALFSYFKLIGKFYISHAYRNDSIFSWQNEDGAFRGPTSLLPSGLMTFFGNAKPLDKSWHEMGLEYNPSISPWWSVVMQCCTLMEIWTMAWCCFQPVQGYVEKVCRDWNGIPFFCEVLKWNSWHYITLVSQVIEEMLQE